MTAARRRIGGADHPPSAPTALLNSTLPDSTLPDSTLPDSTLPDSALPDSALLDPARWPQRAARALVFAMVSVGLAVSAHRLAGGMTADVRVDAASGLALFALGMALSGRERTGRAIATIVLASQAAMHAGFTLAARHDTTGPSPVAQWARAVWCATGAHPATAAQVDAVRAGMGLGPLPTAPHMSQPMSHMPTILSASGLGMIAGHVAAALGTAWWLRRGERAAWALVVHVVRTALPTPMKTIPVEPTAGSVIGQIWTPAACRWANVAPGRGPPNAAAVRPITA